MTGYTTCCTCITGVTNDTDNSITLPYASSKCLAKMIEFLVYHYNHPLPPRTPVRRRQQNYDHQTATGIKVATIASASGSRRLQKTLLASVSDNPVVRQLQSSLVHQHQNQLASNKQPPPDDSLSDWDQAFCDSLDRDTLFELIIASNFLDIRWLLDVCCKAVYVIIQSCCQQQQKKSNLRLPTPTTQS